MTTSPAATSGTPVAAPASSSSVSQRSSSRPCNSSAATQQFGHDQLKSPTKIRAGPSALRRGTRTTLGATDDTIAYEMADATETVRVVVNRSDAPQSVGGLPSGALMDLLSGASMSGPTVSVPARSALILVQ